MFIDIGKPIADAVNTFVEWLIINHGHIFEAIGNALLTVLVPIDQTLRGAPPWAIILAFGAVAFAASRSWIITVAVAILIWMIGNLGLWEQAMQTLAIILVSVCLAIVIGIPLGVAAARSRFVQSLLNPILDLMQTIPSFVYLIPGAMLFGLGKVPAILATVIYATPPLIRLTDLGIRHVDHEVIEASRAFGASRWQILKGVQIPLALPSIMQGINQTIMMALALVVIASMIGARGLGETVLVGLQRQEPGTGLLGGIAIVILAIVFDRVSQALGRRLQAYRTAGG
ncbi:ABC transporter permease [Bauldia sp.]|uniref:ABC transporter permease n=1 Tax=Bauldia sp. TaxID=2575872 RepID=UPI003BAD7F89